jgi:hypothetical protein
MFQLAIILKKETKSIHIFLSYRDMKIKKLLKEHDKKCQFKY